MHDPHDVLLNVSVKELMGVLDGAGARFVLGTNPPVLSRTHFIDADQWQWHWTLNADDAQQFASLAIKQGPVMPHYRNASTHDSLNSARRRARSSARMSIYLAAKGPTDELDSE